MKISEILRMLDTIVGGRSLRRDVDRGVLMVGHESLHSLFMRAVTDGCKGNSAYAKYIQYLEVVGRNECYIEDACRGRSRLSRGRWVRDLLIKRYGLTK